MLLFHYNIVIKPLLIHIFRTFTCKPFRIQDKTLIVNFCFPTVYQGHSVINRYSEWKETKRVKFLHIPKEQSTTAYNKEVICGETARPSPEHDFWRTNPQNGAEIRRPTSKPWTWWCLWMRHLNPSHHPRYLHIRTNMGCHRHPHLKTTIYSCLNPLQCSCRYHKAKYFNNNNQQHDKM